MTWILVEEKFYGLPSGGGIFCEFSDDYFIEAMKLGWDCVFYDASGNRKDMKRYYSEDKLRKGLDEIYRIEIQSPIECSEEWFPVITRTFVRKGEDNE